MRAGGARRDTFLAKSVGLPYACFSRSPRVLGLLLSTASYAARDDLPQRSVAGKLQRNGSSPAEYGGGLKRAIELGWLWMHESGTYVKFTPAGADLFA
jgi:hypothetical protein